MKSLADELPPELAQYVHPEWRKNEAGYWAARDRLLDTYRDKWVGFADGRIIAVGMSPVAVFDEAETFGHNPYVTCVGHENEPCRMRRTSFAYDTSYPGEPLPVVSIKFRPASGAPGVAFDQVIADTGADASALPWEDFKKLGLDLSLGRPGLMAGMAGGVASTLIFRVYVLLHSEEHPCRLQIDRVGHERILGRDVLNRLEVLFRGPDREIVVSP